MEEILGFAGNLMRMCGRVDEGKERIITVLRGLETNVRFMRVGALSGDIDEVKKHKDALEHGISVLARIVEEYYTDAVKLGKMMSEGEVGDGEGERYE